MPFLSQGYLASFPKDELYKWLETYVQIGTHPTTEDGFLIHNKDRFGGMCITGLPGLGKSSLTENLILQDAMSNRAEIIIDPHGDLTDHCIAQMNQELLERVRLLDMQDREWPFSLNILSGVDMTNEIKKTQAIDRIMHVFEVQWPDMTGQLYFPLFLRMAIIVLLANPGTTLIDMYRFVTDTDYRWWLLENVQDPTVKSFWQAYEDLPKSEKQQQLQPLVSRLGLLFAGRPIVRNILGQPGTSINFRKAIEDKEIIFIKLPIKTMTQDARLIGTIIVAEIHAAIFSFSDLPEHKRPDFGLYVDEFQHFASQDFSEMFTEGRKFGVRVTVAHQYRSQLPSFLQQSTMTARTKVCFQLTPEDAREMAHLYITSDTVVRPENIEPKPVEYLLNHDIDDLHVKTFVEWYLRPLQSHKTSGRVEIMRPGFRLEHVGFWLTNTEPPNERIKEADPTHDLNFLLREVMRTGDHTLQIPSQVVYGFANCGLGFYSTFRYALKGRLLSSGFRFPEHLVVETEFGSVWTRPPEDSREQLYHFLYHLRACMAYLAHNPLGKKSTVSASEISRMILQLPRRAAFVRSGEDVGVVYTDDTIEMVAPNVLEARIERVLNQTRDQYCHWADIESTESVPIVKPNVRRWESVK